MFSFKLQKDLFVLFKGAHCKRKTVQVKAEQQFVFWKGGIFRILQSTCTHISSTLLLVNSFKPFDMFHRTCCLGWSWISFHIYNVHHQHFFRYCFKSSPGIFHIVSDIYTPFVGRYYSVFHFFPLPSFFLMFDLRRLNFQIKFVTHPKLILFSYCE